jgi:acyl-coenzyme A synthetase/AMP-(fatty) acid ligase
LDWSLLVTSDGVQHRDGGDYGNEKMVMYTSGTTGDSKFFSYSTTQVQHVVDNIIASYELTANDRFLSVMPLWHGHGHILNYVVATAGMQVHHVRPPDLKKQIEFSPTWVSAIPDILRVMSRTQKFPDLRFARSASVALPDQVFDDLKTSFNTPIIESFGMSEACSHCFTNPLYGEQRIGTIGLPDGIDADIRNGSLWLRGPQCHTADWFDTEDLAEQDSAGYYKILGRRLDRLNLHGIKLNPLSIENQLYNCIPQLNEVVVFGENKMMCVYTGDVAPGQVRQSLADISTHCNPKFLAQVESIPKNTAGKISRSLLKEIYN